MNRLRSFFPLVVLGLVGCWSAVPGQAADRPNIVLIMADDLGWRDVGFNGNTVIQTPHLDTMAAGGLVFDRFYAAAPVCSPTRGSCLSGRHPYRYGVHFANTGHLPSQEHTLAELLKRYGYATGHFGKWHLGTLTRTVRDSNRGGPRGAKHYAPPQEHGFDVCFSTEAKTPTYDPMLKPRRARRTWWDPVDDPDRAQPYGTYYWNEQGDRVTGNLQGDDSRVIMDRAVPFIQSAAENDTPFLTVIWFHAPHLPVVAGPEHTALYDDHDKYAQHYFGCITALDEQIGRLRQVLRETGLADNTLLTFCSDNGPEGNSSAPGSAGPFRGRKRSLFEGGVRVPGVIEWPARIEAGRRTSYPAVTSDYLPTILDILGGDPIQDRPIDGVSLLPVLESPVDQPRPKAIGFESRDQIALNDNRYKLISTDKGKSFMLFDLLEDPGEKNDIAADHPDIVTEMSAELAEWRASCRASNEGKDYPGTK